MPTKNTKKLLRIGLPLAVVLTVAAAFLIRVVTRPDLPPITRTSPAGVDARGPRAGDDDLVRRAVDDWRKASDDRAEHGADPLRYGDEVAVMWAGDLDGRTVVVLRSKRIEARWSDGVVTLSQYDPSDYLVPLRLDDQHVLTPAGAPQEYQVASAGGKFARVTAADGVLAVGAGEFAAAPVDTTGEDWALLTSGDEYGLLYYSVPTDGRPAVLAALAEPAAAGRLMRALSAAAKRILTRPDARSARISWTGELPGLGGAVAVRVNNRVTQPSIAVGYDGGAVLLGRAPVDGKQYPEGAVLAAAPVGAGGSAVLLAVGSADVASIEVSAGGKRVRKAGPVAVVTPTELGAAALPAGLVVTGRYTDGAAVNLLPAA